jgi:hypothetical protein
VACLSLDILFISCRCFTRNNEDLLKFIEETIPPYLFHSDQLASLINVTTSIRTKISIIALIGPRLTDPKAKIPYFTGLFRYVDEKSAVEEILKARAQVLATGMFTRKEGIKSFTGRGGGLVGGRDGTGGGRGNPLFSGRGGRSAVMNRELDGNWHSALNPRSDYSRAKKSFGMATLSVSSDEDSIESNVTPTVFGFDAVLSALDEPFGKSRSMSTGATKSRSLETIQESHFKNTVANENEGDSDDEDDVDDSGENTAHR